MHNESSTLMVLNIWFPVQQQKYYQHCLLTCYKCSLEPCSGPTEFEDDSDSQWSLITAALLYSANQHHSPLWTNVPP